MPDSESRVASDLRQTPQEILRSIAGGHAGAMTVLGQWLRRDRGEGFMGILTCIDSKHLYDHHIWEVYELCGKDLDRFIYHVMMELPDQLTGELWVAGGLYRPFADDEFMEKRTFGKPGSYWALEIPPVETDYAYPIL